MIAFEVLLLLAVSVIAIVGLTAVVRPLAQAYSERLKASYKEIGSDQETLLKNRVSSLEEEIREIKRQMSNLQETADFNTRLLESKQDKLIESNDKLLDTKQDKLLEIRQDQHDKLV